MDKNVLLILLVVGHIIGAIVTIIVHYKTGVFKDAAENGDGIRIANPSDVLFQDLVVWEFLLLIDIFCFFENLIDCFFHKLYNIE